MQGDTQVINKSIVELLNLQDDYELSYEDYKRSLMESLVIVDQTSGKKNAKYTTDEAELLREEFSKVRKLNKDTKFYTKPPLKVRDKKKKINKKELFNRKDKSDKKTNARVPLTPKLLTPAKTKTRKVENLKPKPVESEVKTDTKGGDNIGILQSIDKTLESILGTLVNINKSQKKSTEKKRIQDQRSKRQKKEKDLESGFGGALKKTGDMAKKALSPLKNVWDGIVDFFKKVILGNLFTRFVNWLSDPNNRKTFDTIVGFFADHWPLILGAFVLFGTSFGTFIRWMLGTVVRLTFGLFKVIPKLIAAIAKTKLGLAGLVGAGLFAAGAVIPKLFPQTVDEQERKTEEAPGTKEEKIAKLKEQKSKLNAFDKLRGMESEIDEQIYKLETGETKRYELGGILKPSGESKETPQKKPSFDFGNLTPDISDLFGPLGVVSGLLPRKKDKKQKLPSKEKKGGKSIKEKIGKALSENKTVQKIIAPVLLSSLGPLGTGLGLGLSGGLDLIFGKKKESSPKDKGSDSPKKPESLLSKIAKFSPVGVIGSAIAGAGGDNTLINASTGDAVLTSSDIQDIKKKYNVDIGKNISNSGKPTSGGPEQVAVNTRETILTPEDQKVLYEKHGINIPKYLEGRKTKSVKTSSIKPAKSSFSTGGVVGTYNFGGIISGGLRPEQTSHMMSSLANAQSDSYSDEHNNLLASMASGMMSSKSSGADRSFTPQVIQSQIEILNSVQQQLQKESTDPSREAFDNLPEFFDMNPVESEKVTKPKEKPGLLSSIGNALSGIKDTVSSLFKPKENKIENNYGDTNVKNQYSNIDPKTIDHIIKVCVDRVCSILKCMPGAEGNVESSGLPSVSDVGNLRQSVPTESITDLSSNLSSGETGAPTSFQFFGGPKNSDGSNVEKSGGSSNSDSILKGAKSIIGKGAGVGDQCANTTRAALKAAGHPAASKVTQIGDLDTPKGTAYNAPSFAASFGGSDMGQIITQKSAIKAGDIILWKADRDKGGNINKGAITHVGIAADDGLKNQYDHNRSKGFHYRPHWDSAAGTSWFAGVRLGGSGGSVPSSEGEEKQTPGSSTGGGGEVGDSRQGSPQQEQTSEQVGSGEPSTPTESLVPKSQPTNVESMSIDQLKGMLDPTKTGASNPAVFAAAKQAREQAVAAGLPKEEVERRVLMATVKAKQGGGGNIGSMNPLPGLSKITESTGLNLSGGGADRQGISGGMFGDFRVSPGEMVMNPFVIPKSAAAKGAASEALGAVESIVAKHDSSSSSAQGGFLKSPNLGISEKIKPYESSSNDSETVTLPPISQGGAGSGQPPTSGTSEVFFSAVCDLPYSKVERQRILDTLGAILV